MEKYWDYSSEDGGSAQSDREGKIGKSKSVERRSSLSNGTKKLPNSEAKRIGSISENTSRQKNAMGLKTSLPPDMPNYNGKLARGGV